VRKFLTASLTALTLVGALAIPAIAAPRVKDCTDILSSNGLQDSRASFDGATDIVSGRFYLPTKPCANVTYSLVVLDDETDTTPIVVGSVRGTGKDAWIDISATGVTPSDTDVCVYVTTSIKDESIDRGPSTGCVVLFDDGTSPGGGKGF
jgi:hypothetical protein